MVIVTKSPVEPGNIYDRLRKNNAGSVLFHYAVVKASTGGKRTSGIRFESNSDIEAELSGIETDMKSRWDIEDLLLIRRMGKLNTGDIISLVAVSSPASSDAFEACMHGLERIKKMASIKKTELYVD